MDRAKVIALALLAFTAAGCARDDERRAAMTTGPDYTATYACEEGRTFTAHFTDNQRHAAVDAVGKEWPIYLEEREGERLLYTNRDEYEPDVVLHIDGPDVYLEVDGATDYRNCYRRS
jgi:hypothetical protein